MRKNHLTDLIKPGNNLTARSAGNLKENTVATTRFVKFFDILYSIIQLPPYYYSRSFAANFDTVRCTPFKILQKL